MKLSREDVEHIAVLARLGVTDAEVEKFQLQLSNILENFELLERVDVTGVPPTAQSITLQNVLREDESRASFPPQEILSNAPQQEDGCFRIPVVLE